MYTYAPKMSAEDIFAVLATDSVALTAQCCVVAQVLSDMYLLAIRLMYCKVLRVKQHMMIRDISQVRAAAPRCE